MNTPQEKDTNVTSRKSTCSVKSFREKVHDAVTDEVNVLVVLMVLMIAGIVFLK